MVDKILHFCLHKVNS
uniref:Uncharacterized protein n=1 Tax=Anopheles quadriannulatus TaxID=34691 RepID=A0A182XT15_ANOQN